MRETHEGKRKGTLNTFKGNQPLSKVYGNTDIIRNDIISKLIWEGEKGKDNAYIYTHHTMEKASPDREATAWAPESDTTLTQL